MDLNVIVQAIGSVGFPIVMCLLVYIQDKKTIDELRKSVDNNTEIITKLYEKLGDMNE